MIPAMNSLYIYSMVVLKPQGPGFDPGLANYVHHTMLANNLDTYEDQHKRTNEQMTQHTFLGRMIHVFHLIFDAEFNFEQ